MIHTMSQKPNPINAYTRATHTVAKTRQVVMLYDGAIRFMKQAAEAMEANAIEERYLKLTRVSEIVMGLQNSLDFDVGGATAQVLYDFYSSLDMRIMNLHRKPDRNVCLAIVAEMKEMRDVWDGIDRAKDGDSGSTATAVATAEETPAPSAASTVKVSA